MLTLVKKLRQGLTLLPNLTVIGQLQMLNANSYSLQLWVNQIPKYKINIAQTINNVL